MDALSAIQALNNPSFHARIKHVDIKWHWLRQLIGTIFELSHVRSADMLADMLTKMPVLSVWNSLLPYMSGQKSCSSEVVIRDQQKLPGKGASCSPEGVRKP